MTNVYKLFLIILSFILIFLISGSSQPILVILVITTLIYLLINFFNSISTNGLKKIFTLSIVPLTFLIIVTLNVSGLIGTLTGNYGSENNYIFFIAAPFYLLSIAAYAVEVISGRRKQSSYIDYLLYITLPFKLLSGPLEQPKLLDQITQLKWRFKKTSLLISWPWVVLGGFMKFVIANRLNPIFNLEMVDPISTLLTAAIFELKFYFDFAGYSFMAYGLALAGGIKINHNFNHPFFASNVVFFWRRWHMSLGKFLSRYILEPNLKSIKIRFLKEIFVASIFMISAMWHGGTINYLLWGLFHASCYYGFIKFIKHRDVPKYLATLSMFFFIIIGRLIAIDSDSSRLIQKLLNIVNPYEYMKYIFEDNFFGDILDNSELKATGLAFIFIFTEAYSIKKYGVNRPYHFFRKPIIALIILVLLLFFKYPSSGLLYARI